MSDSAAPLAGRVAVVTGAGRGIGRAHALALAGLGAAVVVNDLGTDLSGRGRDASPAEAVVAEIEARGGQAVADGRDVASIDGGRALVADAVERLGRVDVLVNNAGFALGGGTVEEPDEAGIDALLAVHLKAAIGTMSAAFGVMRANGYGRIVNTVSEVALDTRFAGPLGYGLAKAALWSATLSAAEEGRPYGITVNAISPGARTRMNADRARPGLPRRRVGASSTSHPSTSLRSSRISRRRPRATSPAACSTSRPAPSASTRPVATPEPSSPNASPRLCAPEARFRAGFVTVLGAIALFPGSAAARTEPVVRRCHTSAEVPLCARGRRDLVRVLAARSV